MHTRRLNIVVLTNSNFPVGFASTNRLVSYCRGIVELGHIVKVIVLCPHEKENEPVLNKEVSGTYKGIEYQYASQSTIWPANSLKRAMTVISGLFISLALVIKTNKKNKIDFFFFAGGSSRFMYLIPFYFLSRLFGIRIVREKNEYPAFELKKDKYSSFYKFFAKQYLFKFYDGMLLMTFPLLDYFKSITRKNSKLEIIPMTVEPDRFICSGSIQKISGKYLAYTGTICSDKDGIDILIKAFSAIAENYKDINLVLIGDTSNQYEFKKILELVDNVSLSDRIIFTGQLHRDSIPDYICNATALVLSRPDSLQARGGFPTKLGEYLATGRPVIITKVGDIPVYFNDRINAFLAEPGDVKSFAGKINEVLSNLTEAEKVGIEGKKLTSRDFNYLFQAERIVEYLRCFL